MKSPRGAAELGRWRQGRRQRGNWRLAPNTRAAAPWREARSGVDEWVGEVFETKLLHPLKVFFDPFFSGLLIQWDFRGLDFAVIVGLEMILMIRVAWWGFKRLGLVSNCCHCSLLLSLSLLLWWLFSRSLESQRSSFEPLMEVGNRETESWPLN